MGVREVAMVATSEQSSSRVETLEKERELKERVKLLVPVTLPGNLSQIFLINLFSIVQYLEEAFEGGSVNERRM
jgi:hypothetical protein